MRQGDIILIKFPFSDYVGFKTRPALVVSNSKFNRGCNVIVAAISSQKSNEDFSVRLKNRDLQAGKLLKDSYVRCGSVLAIEKTLIQKTVAVLSGKKLKEVIKKFVSLFDNK